MNTSKTIATAILSLAALFGAVAVQAESYEGVQTVQSSRTRAQVNAQAMHAAHAANQNVVQGSRPEQFRTEAQRVIERAATAALLRKGPLGDAS